MVAESAFDILAHDLNREEVQDFLCEAGQNAVHLLCNNLLC